MAVAVSTTEPEPVLYDAATRTFDPGLLRLAMIKRRLRLEDLIRGTGLARSTVQSARAGRPVADGTAIAIFRELERVSPMEVL